MSTWSEIEDSDYYSTLNNAGKIDARAYYDDNLAPAQETTEIKSFNQMREDLSYMSEFSDSDVFDYIHKTNYPDMKAEDLAKAIGYTDKKDKNQPNQFVAGLKTGVDQTQSLGYGLASLAGDAIDSDSLRRWGMEGYSRNIKESQDNGLRVNDYEDVNTIGDAIDYALGGLGQLVPTVASVIATGGIGGIIAKQGIKYGSKKMIKDLVSNGVEKKAAEATAASFAGRYAGKAAASTIARGQAIGATAATIGMETGEIYGDVAAEGAEGARAIAYSLTGGAIAGALDVLPVLGVAKKFGFGGELKKRIADKIAKRGLLTNIAVGATGTAVFEGATESVQTLIEEETKAIILERDLPADIAHQMTNAALLGAIGGSVMGGVGGAFTPSKQNLIDSAKELDAESNQAGLDNIANSESVDEAVSSASEAVNQGSVEADLQSEFDKQAAMESVDGTQDTVAPESLDSRAIQPYVNISQGNDTTDVLRPDIDGNAPQQEANLNTQDIDSIIGQDSTLPYAVEPVDNVAPIELTTKGVPFKTAKSAGLRMKGKEQTHDIAQVDGGFGIQAKPTQESPLMKDSYNISSETPVIDGKQPDIAMPVMSETAPVPDVKPKKNPEFTNRQGMVLSKSGKERIFKTLKSAAMAAKNFNGVEAVEYNGSFSIQTSESIERAADKAAKTKAKRSESARLSAMKRNTISEDDDLHTFIRKHGGVSTLQGSEYASEFKMLSESYPSSSSFSSQLGNNKSPISADGMAELAYEAGYISSATPSALHEAVDNGKDTSYTPEGHYAAVERKSIEQSERQDYEDAIIFNKLGGVAYIEQSAIDSDNILEQMQDGHYVLLDSELVSTRPSNYNQWEAENKLYESIDNEAEKGKDTNGQDGKRDGGQAGQDDLSKGRNDLQGQQALLKGDKPQLSNNPIKLTDAQSKPIDMTDESSLFGAKERASAKDRQRALPTQSQPSQDIIAETDKLDYNYIYETSKAKETGGLSENAKLKESKFQPDQNARVPRQAKLVKTGKISTGITKILSSSDVAHVSASLRKNAQENLVAIVTDKDGNIINIIKHSIGKTSSTQSDPTVFMGAIASVKGAKNVWLSHNHPSGTAELSEGDVNSTKRMAESLKPLNINVQNIIAVTPDGKFASLFNKDTPITPRIRGNKIDLVERKFIGANDGIQLLDSSGLRKANKSINPNGKTGIIIANHAKKAMRFIELTKVQMNQLKKHEGKVARELLTAIHEGNGKSIFPVVNSQSFGALNNLQGFANRFDLEFIDAIDIDTGETFSEQGNMPNRNSSEVYYSKSNELVSPKEAKEVQANVEGKTAIEVATWLSESAPSKSHRIVAESVLNKLKTIESIGGKISFNVAHIGDEVNPNLRFARGMAILQANSSNVDIFVNGADVTDRVGVSHETVLHELVHAATVATIQDGRSGRSDAAKLAMLEYNRVQDAIKEHYVKRLAEFKAGKGEFTEFEQTLLLGGNNALKNADEIIAWAFTNKTMQDYLETIPYKNTTLWGAFVKAVRRALGLKVENDTALSEILKVGKTLIDDQPLQYDSSSVSFGSKETLMATAHPRASDVALYSQNNIDITSDNFRNWAGTDEVIEDNEINDFDFSGDGPFVMRVFHGTTHDINIFNASINGTKEGQFGAVNYFTSSEYDAEQNYTSEGVDLTYRIEQRGIDIRDSIADMPLRQIVDTIPSIDENAASRLSELYDEKATSEDESSIDDEIEEITNKAATKELNGGSEQVMELFVRTNKPFIVSDGSPWFEFMDESTLEDDAIEAVAADERVDIDDIRADLDAYKSQIDEMRWQLREEIDNDLVDAIETVAMNNDIDTSEVLASMYDDMADGSITHQNLERLLRGNEGLANAVDPETGDIVGYHIVGEIIQELGFDSIILKDAEQRFTSMDMGDGITHIHVFDADNTNIKSATDNSGAYNKSNPDIFASKGKSPSTLSIAQAEQSLIKTFGSAIKRAIKSGRVVIHRTADDVNGDVIYFKDGTVQGWTDKGVVNIVAENNTESTLASTLLHESLHSFLDGNSKAKTNAFKRLDAMRKIAGKRGKVADWIKAAEARAEAAETPQSQFNDEILAYSVTNYEQAPMSIKKWVDTFIGEIRAMLIKQFGLDMKITPSTLRGLARQHISDMSSASKNVTVAELWKATSQFKSAFQFDKSNKKSILYSKEQDSVDELNAKLTEDNEGDWNNAYEIDKELTSHQILLKETFAKTFGVRLEYVKATSSEFEGIGGLEYNGVIYVNSRGNIGFVQLAGHELLHHIRSRSEELYQYLAGQAQKLGMENDYEGNKTSAKNGSKGIYVEKYQAFLRANNQDYTIEQSAEELLADFVGDALVDPEFLKLLAKDNPTSFKKLMKVVIDWLSDVSSKLSKKGFESSGYISDVDELKGYLWEVLDEFSKSNNAEAISNVSDIKYSKNKEPSSWNNEETLLEWFEAKFMYRWNRIEKMQNKVAEDSDITSIANAVKKEATFYGKVGEHFDDAIRAYITPSMDALKPVNLATEDLEDYMYAIHAPERNAAILEIDENNSKGSGITNEEALAKLERFSDEEIKALKKSASYIRVMLDNGLDLMVKNGAMTVKQRDVLKKKYPNYIPLSGNAEEQDIVSMMTGKKFDVRGSEVKNAFGRTSEAINILPLALSSYQASAIRSEKAVVGQAIAQLYLKNPDSDIWKLHKIDTETVVDEGGNVIQAIADMDKLTTYVTTTRKRIAGGKVVNTIDPSWSRKENIFAFKINGIQYYLDIKDEALARQLKGLGVEDMGIVIKTLGRINRWLSSAYTSLNPDFVFTNASRDVIQSLENLYAQNDSLEKLHGDPKKLMKGLKRDVLKNWGKAAKAVYQREMDSENRSAFSDWYDEYRKAGGKIAFYSMQDLDTIRNKMEDKLSSGKFTKETAMSIVRFVQGSNAAVENAVRLSTYAALRQRGISMEDAAYTTRNLTVDFNRKGESGSTVNALFLFFNAATQGTRVVYQIAKALLSSKGGRAFLASQVVLGYILAEVAREAMGEGDDGRDKWDMLNDYQKRRNLIFGYGEGDNEIFKIPLPYGLNLIPNIGYWMNDIAHYASTNGRKGKSPFKVSVEALKATFTSTSPIGQLFPTVAMPIYEIGIMNENFMSLPINKEQSPYSKYKLPDSSMNFSRYEDSWKKSLAEAMNSMTGGDSVTPGMLDVGAGTVNYMLNFVFGGLGSTVGRVADLAKGTTNNFENIDIRDIPVARNFITGVSKYQDSGDYRKNIIEPLRRYEQWDNAPMAEKSALKLSNFKMISLGREVKRKEKILRRLFKRLKKSKIAENKSLVKILNQKIHNVQVEFNKEYYAKTR